MLRNSGSIVNCLISYGGDICVKEQWIDSKSIEKYGEACCLDTERSSSVCYIELCKTL